MGADEPWGAALAQRLRGLAADLEAGRLPARAAERLDAATSCAISASAIRRMAELLNPDGTRRPTPLAAEIEARLARFEATGWRRVRAGLRAPAGELEATMAEVLRHAAGCRSGRRIRDLLD